MKIKSKWVYVVFVIALSIGMVLMYSGCPQEPDTGEPPPENGADPVPDGTITVRVTGASDHNGKNFYYAVGAAGTSLRDSVNWLGVAPTSPTISGGTVECVTVEVASSDPAILSGGVTYDVSGMIDVDLSGTNTSGDYGFGIQSVIVDGDTDLELVYPIDFGQNGTLTISITGANVHDGCPVFAGVWFEGDDTNDMSLMLAENPDPSTLAGGAVDLLMEDVVTGNACVFDGSPSYDVGGIIDANLDDTFSLGDYMFGDGVGPITVQIDGDTTLNLVYPDDFTLAE